MNGKPPLQAVIVPVTPFQQNCSVVWCTKTSGLAELLTRQVAETRPMLSTPLADRMLFTPRQDSGI
jgi:hypothetical protein